jgi:hypothetical protein
LNTDASLQGIEINGTSIPDFRSDTYLYEFECDKKVNEIEISAITNDEHAFAVINLPTELPGLAHIFVTAEDYVTTQDYKVNISAKLLATINQSHRSLYPNPVLDVLHVEHDNLVRIKIFDLLGREVLSTALKPNEKELDLSELKSGVYVIAIWNDQYVSSDQFLKF